MSNKLGRPNEKAGKIVELWVEIIENRSDVDPFSELTEKELRTYFYGCKLYKENEKRYKSSVSRVKTPLDAGVELNLFEKRDQRWKLTDPVISVIQSEKFKREREANSEKSIDTLLHHIEEKTWKDYYEATLRVPINIPDTLERYNKFPFREPKNKKTQPRWFKSTGIEKQEYDAGFYPKQSIQQLRIQIEKVWEKGRGVVFFAKPAHGKTTSVSILQHEWSQDDNKTCLMIQSSEWKSRHQDFEDLFSKSLKTNSSYRFIVVIENIHLVWGKIDDFEEILSRYDNVRFILTSRVSAETLKEVEKKSSAEIVEVIDFPKGYPQELIWSIIEFYNIGIDKNRAKIKSLISESQDNNILFTLSKIGFYLEIESFYVPWSNQIEDLISSSIKHTEIRNSDYWHWTFLLLSTFRKYEIEVTKRDFYNGYNLYDSSISLEMLGKTYTYLLNEGFLIESSTSSQSYFMALHPVSAEETANILEKTLDYLEIEVPSELQIMSNYLKKKGVEQFRIVKEKLGLNFNKLELSFSETLDYLKPSIDEEDWIRDAKRIETYSILNQHPKFFGLMEEIFDISVVKRFILNFRADFYGEEDIRFHIIDHFDPKLMSIEIREFLEELDLKKDSLKISPNKMGESVDQIGLLFERRPGFVDECQEYLSHLQFKGKINRFSHLIPKIPSQELSRLDFKNIGLPFLIALCLEPYKQRTTNQSPYAVKCVKSFKELCTVWNGPSYKKTMQVLFESINTSVQNFDQRLVLYDLQNKSDIGFETKYELDNVFLKSLKDFNEKGYNEDCTFYPPSEDILQKMTELSNREFTRRLLLLYSNFRDYYDLIIRNNNCQVLVRKIIADLLRSEEKWEAVSSMTAFIQICLDFNFKLLLEEISDIEIISEMKHYGNTNHNILSIIDFSRLEEIILTNPFYDWTELMQYLKDKHEMTRYTNREVEERRLDLLVRKIGRTWPLSYERITPQKLIEGLQAEPIITPASLDISLKMLDTYVDSEVITLDFFQKLERIIENHLKTRKNYFIPKDEYVRKIWSNALEFDLPESTKREIYSYCIRKFEDLGAPPLLEARDYKNFDLSLFTDLLFEIKRDKSELIYYLGNLSSASEESQASEESKRELYNRLSRISEIKFTDKLANEFEMILEWVLQNNILKEERILDFFKLDFYAKAYHANQDSKRRVIFLNFLATSVLTESFLSDLARRISLNQISLDLLKIWDILSKRSDTKISGSNTPQINFRKIIHTYEENKFFKILFNSNIGKSFTKKAFQQIDFEYYEKKDRYMILLSLDELFLEDREMKDVISNLHAELIREREDPYFIIDPILIIHPNFKHEQIFEKHQRENPFSIIDPSFRYEQIFEKHERLFSLLEGQERIRSELKNDFESIIFPFYERKYDRFRGVIPDTLFYLIIKTWGSLADFSEDLESWEESSKGVLYETLFEDNKYFENVKQIFKQSFRVQQEKKGLLKITVSESISGFLNLLDKYDGQATEVGQIFRSTRMEDWNWDLSKSEVNDPWITHPAPYSTAVSHRTQGYLYLSKIWSLRDYFGFNVSYLIQKMILNMNVNLLYEVLSQKNQIKKQFREDFVKVVPALSLFDLMDLIILSESEDFSLEISMSIAKKLEESEFNPSIFLRCLNYAFYCQWMLEQHEQENISGIIELKKILLKRLKAIEEEEVSKILYTIRSIEVVILTAYCLSQSNFLSLFELNKENIELLVDFFIRISDPQGNMLAMILKEWWIKDNEGKLRELNYQIPHQDIWDFVDSHLKFDWITALRESKSYRHLLELLSQDYINSKLKGDYLKLAVESVFAPLSFKDIRELIDQTKIDNTSEVISRLSEVFAKFESIFAHNDIEIVLDDVVSREYLKLLAQQ